MSAEARAVIHAASCHSQCESQTRDADFGGNSQWNAYGSAFSCWYPAKRDRTLNLYEVPVARAGTNISQTPPLRRRMGWRRVSQSLNSPASETVSAFGAHTAKRTPAAPSLTT